MAKAGLGGAHAQQLDELQAARSQAVEQLCGELARHPQVRVQHISKERGKGLFAAHSAASGDVLVSEQPLVGLQSNRDDLLACAACYRPLGCVQLQLDVAAGVCGRSDAADYQGWALDAGQPQLTDCLVPCQLGCGELYCTAECWQRDHDGGHRLLCVGPLASTDHPLYQFKVLACTTHEEFLQAAKVLAAIASSHLRDPTQTLAQLAGPYLSFQAAPWWDVAVLPSNGKLRRTDLKLRARKAVGLLRAAFGNYGAEGLLAPLFTLDFFGLLIGTLELNNIGMRVTSPVTRYLQAVQDSRDHLPAAVGQALRPKVLAVLEAGMEACSDEECEDDKCGGDDHVHEEGHTLPGLQADGELDLGWLTHPATDPFPPFDGTALYRIACSINHSCTANCRVDYERSGTGPVQLALVAVGAIAAGDELTISYIDPTLPLAERRRALANYGFVCTCTRCATEEAQPHT